MGVIQKVATFAWKGFLEQWSRDLLQDPDVVEDLPVEVVASGWFGYPGATEAQIAQAEVRLGTVLPPSYRDFLRVSNGWRRLTPFVYRLWSTEEIEWFSVRNQDWIDAWNKYPRAVSDTDYFIYGEGQRTERMRVEYMRTALEISETGDSAILLLNPQVVTGDGEWEAWFLANWSGGAARYRSFLEMMQAQYESFLDLREQAAHDLP